MFEVAEKAEISPLRLSFTALPKLLCKDAIELSIYCIKNTIKNSWKLYMERVDNMYYNDKYRIFSN
jgi:hypothetical protein